jgi:hypothetical protein
MEIHRCSDLQKQPVPVFGGFCGGRCDGHPNAQGEHGKYGNNLCSFTTRSSIVVSSIGRGSGGIFQVLVLREGL